MSNNCCPSCGAQNWKYAEAVYQQGITYSDTGEVFQSELSKRAAPPIKQDSSSDIISGLLLLVFLIGVPIVYFSSPEMTFWGAVFSGKLWIIAIVLAVIFSLIIGKESNEVDEKQYNIDYEQWRNTKVCMQCSYFFR